MNIDNSLQVFVEMRPSKRLSYRLLTENDFELFYKVNTDERIMMFAYEDVFLSVEEGQIAFDLVLAKQRNDQEGTIFVVSEIETDTDIGYIEYFIRHLHHSGGIYELSYSILPEFWGNGYATEMGTNLIDYLFHNYNIHKIVVTCHIDNRRSESTMKKLFMSKEGIIRKSRYKDRRWVDEVKYGLLKEEWCCEEE